MPRRSRQLKTQLIQLEKKSMKNLWHVAITTKSTNDVCLPPLGSLGVAGYTGEHFWLLGESWKIVTPMLSYVWNPWCALAWKQTPNTWQPNRWVRSVLERCQQSHSGPRESSLLASVFQNVLRPLRSNDADHNENVKKTIGLISKTTTSRVHQTFLYISFPFLHDYDMKMPNFAFYGGRKQPTTSLNLVPWNSASGGFAYTWQNKWVGIIAIKTERTQFFFLATFLSPSRRWIIKSLLSNVDDLD